MNDAFDDGVCQHCGRCCRTRYLVKGETYVVQDNWCPHLDTLTGLCKVFAVRHQVAPWCLTVETAIPQRAYPRDCPYVKNLMGYEPPIEVRDVEQVRGLSGVEK